MLRASEKDIPVKEKCNFTWFRSLQRSSPNSQQSQDPCSPSGAQILQIPGKINKFIYRALSSDARAFVRLPPKINGLIQEKAKYQYNKRRLGMSEKV